MRLKRVKKRNLLNNPRLAWLAGALLNAYGQLVLLTSRLRVDLHPATAQLLRQQRQPVIFALWHCHVFFLPLLRHQAAGPLAVLLSGHRDGQIVGVTVRQRGLALVTGSSTRGGVGATLRLLQLLRTGTSVCITPDGPKGPPQQVKPGVLHLARRSGRALVPVAVAMGRRRRLRSWDRTLLPLPFGRVVISLGPPLLAAAEPLGPERLAAALEASAARAGQLLSGGGS